MCKKIRRKSCLFLSLNAFQIKVIIILTIISIHITYKEDTQSKGEGGSPGSASWKMGAWAIDRFMAII